MKSLTPLRRTGARIGLLAALLSLAVPAVAASEPNPDWTGYVTVAPGGSHVLGNPAAGVKLAEFVSYTCPHCAVFHIQSDGPLQLAYVGRGKVSVEVRHLVRDPVDLTAAMLANCGDPARFFQNHSAFMYTQDSWIGLMGRASAGQKQRWTSGPMAQRLRAIASDFGFYDIMERHGYSRSEADQCLSSDPQLKQLMAQTKAAIDSGVEGTPSFMLNGMLLSGTHDWETLDAQIQARM